MEEAGDDPDSQEVQGGKEKGPDYDYLLGMPMWNLTQEKKDEICRKRDEKNPGAGKVDEVPITKVAANKNTKSKKAVIESSDG